ncbi:MAG: hypothetical protein GF341_03220, partial [candidate division Zixibacteria bacterium]|nr:hypothetical protein [candidate division Zixibacteria bacterium]
MMNQIRPFGLLIVLVLPLTMTVMAPTANGQTTPVIEEDEFINTVIGTLDKKRGRIGETLTFQVASPSAPDPGVRVIANNLPPGATFTDLGDGYGEFNWTPVTGQSGAYEVEFTDNTPGPTAMPPAQALPVIIAAYPLSHGFYRIPYDDGITFRVSRDHITH